MNNRYDKTQNQCSNDCLRGRVTAKLGIIPTDVTIHINETVTHALYSNLYKNQMFDAARNMSDDTIVSLHQMMDSCARQCQRRECQSVIHVPKLESERPIVGRHNVISIFSSRKPMIRAVTQPAVPLITFWTNLLSTFGFWLGVSVYGSFPLMVNAVLQSSRLVSSINKKNEPQKRLKQRVTPIINMTVVMSTLFKRRKRGAKQKNSKNTSLPPKYRMNLTNKVYNSNGRQVVQNTACKTLNSSPDKCHYHSMSINATKTVSK